MSVRWERLAGDTSTFAIKVAFADDPHDGACMPRDLASSWGALQIWANGINLTSHTDGGQTVDAAYWYLLPILEWLAGSWEPLFHEERLPQTSSAEDAASVTPPWSEAAGYDRAVNQHVESDWQWRSRHALRTAREGGLLPGVFIRRHRDAIEISWRDTPLAGATDVKYLAPEGRALVDPDLVADAVHSLASEAAAWLLERRTDSTRLRALVEALARIPDTPTEPRLAWLAGLGTSLEDSLGRWRRTVQQVSKVFDPEVVKRATTPAAVDSGLVVSGSPVATLLFGSAAPNLVEQDVLELMSLAVGRETVDESPLAGLVAPASLPVTDEVWEQGYELGLDAFDVVWDDGGLLNMERVLANLGVELVSVDLSDDQIRAVSLAGSDRKPTVAVNEACSYNQEAHSRRFTLAHELCHLLHDQGVGVKLAIASGPWAPIGLERRANAFAAMLLMPPMLIYRARKKTAMSLTTLEGSHAIAESLQVSHSALVHHAANLGLLTRDIRDRLLNSTETP